MTAHDASRSHRTAVIADIVDGHHANARRALPYIVTLLARVAGFHGKRNGKLNALCDAGHELADALEAHLDDQERQLFPALAAGSGEGLRRELEKTHGRHRQVEQLLERIRSLADGYVAPEWGDHGYRALMEELAALEDDVLRHMRLESSILPGLLSRHTEAC
jgi:regulator of cell morphogenesis and NO signaling